MSSSLNQAIQQNALSSYNQHTHAEKLMKLMEIIDEHKETLGDGDYLKACNLLKDLNKEKKDDFKDEIEELEALYRYRQAIARQIRIGIFGLRELQLGENDLYRVSITALEPVVVVKHDDNCTPRCRRHKPTIQNQPCAVYSSMTGRDLQIADSYLRSFGVFDSSLTPSLQNNLNTVLRNDAPHAKIKEKSYVIISIELHDSNIHQTIILN